MNQENANNVLKTVPHAMVDTLLDLIQDTIECTTTVLISSLVPILVLAWVWSHLTTTQWESVLNNIEECSVLIAILITIEMLTMSVTHVLNPALI